jgi:ATP-dependent DNA ligase
VTDPRLVLAELVDPTALQIRTRLDQQVALGDEGLILRQGDKWLKVKTKYTADVRVTGLMAGGGKYVGVLGAFETDFGNVGTGLTDAERARYNSESMIGALIEVEFMEMTPAGKFRHPRFVRIREDKDEVSIESEIPDHKGGS